MFAHVAENKYLCYIINSKSRKGNSTMYYKDEDFTPEALCQEIEEMFDMDCIDCGAPIPIKWNDHDKCYQTIKN